MTGKQNLEVFGLFGWRSPMGDLQHGSAVLHVRTQHRLLCTRRPASWYRRTSWSLSTMCSTSTACFVLHADAKLTAAATWQEADGGHDHTLPYMPVDQCKAAARLYPISQAFSIEVHSATRPVLGGFGVISFPRSFDNRCEIE